MNKQKRAWKRTINRGTMKQTVIILLVLGTFIAGNPSARADSENPFGFETNTHPLEYEYCKRNPGHFSFRGHGYTCSSAPRPHPDLQEYQLQFVKDVGLCVIVASARPSRAYNHIPYHVNAYFLNDYKTHIAKFLNNIVLNNIGVERDDDTKQLALKRFEMWKKGSKVERDDDTKQLAHILGAYMSLSPRHGQQYVSAKIPREEVAALNDAFQEMKRTWPVADPSNALKQWEQHLKRLFEEDVRSHSLNMFEVFKRQLTNKYGPSSSVPEETAARDLRVRQLIQRESSGDIIKDTRKEILWRYHGGYRWELAQGFERAGDIRSIRLFLRPEDYSLPLFEGGSHKVMISFQFVAADACREKIDEKASRAF